MGIKDRTAEQSNGLLFPPIREFGGVNTRDARTAIKDTEFAWLENVMPIGHGNLAVVPGKGAIEASIPAPATTITYARYYTRSGTAKDGDFVFIFTADGRLFEFSTATSVLTRFDGGTVFTAPTIDQWKSERIVIIDPARGFFDWDGTTLTLLSNAVLGTTIGVYAGRVFICNGRTVSATAVNSYSSFAGDTFSFILTEGKLRKKIYAVEASNNYLYLIGDSAVYVIGDITVTGGVAFYSVVNLTSEAGTIFRTGVSTLERVVFMVDTHGITALLGSQPQRLSAPLDGIYPNIDFSQAPSMAVAKLFGIQCVFVLFPAFNNNGTVRSLIVAFFDGKWFFISDTANLKYIWHAQEAGVDVLYGTNGTDIFHLNWDATVQVPIKIQTKLFDLNDPYTTKEMVRIGIEANITQINNITCTVDTLGSSSAPLNFSLSNVILWINNSSQTVTWQNNATQPVQWISGGSLLVKGDAEGGGKYVGFTLSGLAGGLTLIGLLGEYNRSERW